MNILLVALLFLVFPTAVLASDTAPVVSSDAFFDTTMAAFELIMNSAASASAQLSALFDDFKTLPTEFSNFLERLAQGGFSASDLFLRTLFYLGLGLAVEIVFRLIANKALFGETGKQSVTMYTRMAWLGVNLAGLAIFAALGGWPLLMSAQASSDEQTVVVTYLAAIIGVRLFAIVMRMVFAPFTPQMRIVNMSDKGAKRLYRDALVIASFAICAAVTATLLQLGGMASNAVLIFILITRTIVAFALVIAFFMNRAAVANVLRFGPDGRVRRGAWGSFAGVWHLLASLYVAISWFVASVLLLLGRTEVNGLAILSFCLLIALLTFCLLLDDWSARVDARSEDIQDDPEFPSFARFFASLGQASATVATVILLTRLWSGPWADLVSARVALILPALTQLLITIFLAYILWQLVKIGSDRVLRRNAASDGPEGSIRYTRVATLLPMIRNVILLSIFVVATLIGLSAIGVDVLPLFAGAGVVGLAIGLGSQTLVKDVVSGLFFLLDDAFRVGDYVDTGVALGTVERAGIRSLQIRHYLGALHTVPFGEIRTIANHSRDWAVFTIDLRVPFDTDTDHLSECIRVLGLELMEDEVYGAMFISPLESQGAVLMDEGAMVVRASFRTRPGDQYILRRVVYEAVRKMFREQSIDVAIREVRVREAGTGLKAAVAANEQLVPKGLPEGS